MGKGKKKDEGDGTTRESTILWDEDQTKFMLGCFINYIKEQHAGFKIKKQHHFKCSETLNRQFNMGVIATQVERHFRHYKENWKFIRTALSRVVTHLTPQDLWLSYLNQRRLTYRYSLVPIFFVNILLTE
jgi:hypothetical protein